MIKKYSSSTLFFSILIFYALFSFLFLYSTKYYDLFSREDHIAEYASAILLFLSGLILLVGAKNIKSWQQKTSLDNFKFISFAIIGILFIVAAGEEISWGQRIFGLETPDKLLEINDQNELNFHNINKKLFDRILDRATVLIVLISTIMIIIKQKKFLNIEMPDLLICCSFGLTTFYTQHNSLKFEFFHLCYISFIALLIYSIAKNEKKNSIYLFITLITSSAIIYLHHRFNELFPISNNSANEYKEFLFSLCCFGYATFLFINSKKLSTK